MKPDDWIYSVLQIKSTDQVGVQFRFLINVYGRSCIRFLWVVKRAPCASQEKQLLISHRLHISGRVNHSQTCVNGCLSTRANFYRCSGFTHPQYHPYMWNSNDRRFVTSLQDSHECLWICSWNESKNVLRCKWKSWIPILCSAGESYALTLSTLLCIRSRLKYQLSWG